MSENTNTKLVDLVDVLMDIIENHLSESDCQHCKDVFSSVFHSEKKSGVTTNNTESNPRIPILKDQMKS